MAKKPKKSAPDIAPELVAEWRAKLARPATVLKVTKKVPKDPLGSRFGAITVMEPGEEWPQCPSGPMIPLAQLNLREAPYLPEILADLAMIRVWMDPDWFERHTDKGEGWCVRASRSLDALAAAKEPDHGSELTPMGFTASKLDADFASFDDLSDLNVPAAIRDNRYDLYPHTDTSTKLGGWPSPVQSRVTWGMAWGKPHPILPEFAFQIDAEFDAGWSWGDGGTGYFGRGTGTHRDEWAFESQCY